MLHCCLCNLRVELLAAAIGLFCAIVTVAFPLEDLDALRQTLKEGGVAELRVLVIGEMPTPPPQLCVFVSVSE